MGRSIVTQAFCLSRRAGFQPASWASGQHARLMNSQDACVTPLLTRPTNP